MVASLQGTTQYAYTWVSTARMAKLAKLAVVGYWLLVPQSTTRYGRLVGVTAVPIQLAISPPEITSIAIAIIDPMAYLCYGVAGLGGSC